jgi:TetR/AcrR family transcriptional regulator, regulator of autoinduction and epiphytic fitness
MNDPRAQRTRQSVLDGVTSLIANIGLGAITMDGVAARAHISRSTLYRHFGELDDLIIAAVEHCSPPRTAVRGTPIERITAMIDHLGASLRTEPWASVSAALAEAGNRSVPLGKLHAAYVADRRRPVVAAVRQAQRAGTVRAEHDPHRVVDLLAGPMYYRHLVMHRAMTASEVANHVNSTLSLLA